MSAKVSQIVFLAETVLRLLTRFWTKMSENSYLREFCAQVSQIVFLADLTVLRLITTVWAKMAENSYLREFIAQVSQIVFLADLTVLQLITTVWTKIVTKLISPRVLCTSVTNRVLTWFDRFMAYNCIENVISYLHELCAQISQIVFLADLTVLRLITTVWAKNLKKLISPRVLCTTITNRVFSWFDRFTAY